ncbi:PulJ/GspJ family protein [Bryobacter aggregatus]|uniref:PulJ/GspJ family protein n=1 Tax=Bryobacter aggregatus TaxID=360054 RepID=UPI0004E21971|nr:type II secretion system protein [Bryobacter aggregatus]
MRRRSRQAGMTLIELLIAVTLFAAISASIGVVLRIAFTSMDKIDSKVDLTRRVISSQRAIDQILSGMVPVVTPCGPMAFGFSGSATAARFVSSFSLTEGSRGRLQIVELFSAPNPKGGVRLLLNEYPYLGKRSLTAVCAAPATVRESSFILADRLASCQFAFRHTERESGMERWAPAWFFPDWPTAIRIEMVPLEIIPNQIQPTTVITPLLVRNTNADDPNR